MATRNSAVTPFLLGVLVTLGFTILNQNQVLPMAYAEGAAGNGGIYMVTNNGTQTQGKDLLFIVESSEDFGKRLAVYEYQGGNLNLGAVRDIGYDLRFQSWARPGKKQEPSVQEQEKRVKKLDGKKSRAK